MSNDKEDTLKLTPYQGKCRAFGRFKCEKCNREWSSAHTWANCWQKCFDCNVQLYPFRQWKLKKRNNSGVAEPGKKHQSSLCGKCQMLGHPCSKWSH
ncbi:zinc finger CCHC domain-containing protein 24-like [Anopheles bellator]|uniref:zinc finger CCHC domain-containing protein 24-like n=1 Tax=Anopheles bellator TaxID=139047 RepID=UPI002649B3CD|nr:zinc finger CCHC domain-containing protein 24-like [Anopheles bellator]